MEEVRIPLLNKKFFLETVGMEPALKGEAKCSNLLLETANYFLDPMLIKQSKRTVPRKSYNNTTIEPDLMTSNPTPIAAQPPNSTSASGEVTKPLPGPSNSTPCIFAMGGATFGMFLKLFLTELNILHAIIAASRSWVNKLKTLIHLLTFRLYFKC